MPRKDKNKELTSEDIAYGVVAPVVGGMVLGAMGGAVANPLMRSGEHQKARDAYVAAHPEIIARLPHAEGKSPEELANQAIKEMQEKKEMSAQEIKAAYDDLVVLYTAKQKADAALEQEFLDDRTGKDKRINDQMANGAAAGLLGGAGLGMGVAGRNIRKRRREEESPEEQPSRGR